MYLAPMPCSVAPDMLASGAGFNKTREMGRWVSEQSLRTYIDITASSSILVSFRLRALTGAMGYACAHLLRFFPGASQYARTAPLDAANHGSEGPEVGQGPGHVSATARGASAIDARCVLAVTDNVDAFDKVKTAFGHASALPLQGRARGRGRGGSSGGSVACLEGTPGTASRGSRGKGRHM